jgi:hypothetical protein
MSQVEHGVCVEQVMLALEEDSRHVLEEPLEVGQLLSGLDVVHQLEDCLAGTE